MRLLSVRRIMTMTGFSNRLTTSLTLLVLACATSSPAVESVAPNPDAANLVSQKKINNTACGACSIYNMLANGRPEFRKIANALPGDTPEDRVRHILGKYGGSPSIVYKNRSPATTWNARTAKRPSSTSAAFTRCC